MNLRAECEHFQELLQPQEEDGECIRMDVCSDNLLFIRGEFGFCLTAKALIEGITDAHVSLLWDRLKSVPCSVH